METITSEQIQKKIAEYIRQSGMTQKEIAQRLHISQQCVSAYVRGKKMPAPDTLANLCALLDADANDVLCLKRF